MEPAHGHGRSIAIGPSSPPACATHFETAIGFKAMLPASGTRLTQIRDVVEHRLAEL